MEIKNKIIEELEKKIQHELDSENYHIRADLIDSLSNCEKKASKDQLEKLQDKINEACDRVRSLYSNLKKSGELDDKNNWRIDVEILPKLYYDGGLKQSLFSKDNPNLRPIVEFCLDQENTEISTPADLDTIFTIFRTVSGLSWIDINGIEEYIIKISYIIDDDYC